MMTDSFNESQGEINAARYREGEDLRRNLFTIGS